MELKLNEENITFIKQIKFSGLTFNEKLTFKTHKKPKTRLHSNNTNSSQMVGSR